MSAKPNEGLNEGRPQKPEAMIRAWPEEIIIII
jgi:hypothetical protein